MIEYRLGGLPERLAEILDEIGAFVAEEEFKGVKSYLVYASEPIDDFLTAFGVKFASKDVEETGWQDKWKDFIQEGWLNESIYFVFEPKAFPDGRKTIFINPSFAFGTGTHATTKIAARLLEPVCAGKTMLDVGAGSGILSIAASKLGAKNIWAFDVDPAALPNCLENVRNNGADNVYPWAGDVSSVRHGAKFDIVCANIISGVLLSLKDEISAYAGEYIICSGILPSEYGEVMPALTPRGWSVEAKLEDGGWCGARLRNDSGHR